MPIKPKHDITPHDEKLDRSIVNIRFQQPTEENGLIGYYPAPLCHVFFPYKNPGNQVDYWQREHGKFALSFQALKVTDPMTKQNVTFGVPFGAKARIILMALNTLAKKQKSPSIRVGNNITDFVEHTLGLNPDGYTIKEVARQFNALKTAVIQMTYRHNDNHTSIEGYKLVRNTDLWWGRDYDQYSLFNSELTFSDDYYLFLEEFAVPVDRRVFRALDNNARAIDLYTFLTHRLWMLDKPLPISWAALKAQFDYTDNGRMDNFKAKFAQDLRLVKQLYPDAKVDADTYKHQGIIFYPSPPPVRPKNYYVVSSNHTLPQNPFSHLNRRKDPNTLSERGLDHLKRLINRKK